MEWKELSISALVFAILSQVVHTIGAFATMGYYIDPAYFPIWSNLMMPGPSPPGLEFYAVSFAFSLLAGLIFAFTYSALKKGIPGKDLVKGVNYGILLFLLADVTYAMTTFVILAVPSALLVSWALEGLVINIAFGAALSRIMK
jgi:hypothetical protein